MLLAVMSIEKFIALYFPLKAKSYCTVGTAKWVTFSFAIVIASFNSPILIGLKAIGKYCFATKHFNYLDMLNTSFYALVPIAVMLLANAAIIYKLMYIKYYGMSRTNESVSKSSTRGNVMVVTVSLTFIILTSPRAVDSCIQLKLSNTQFGRLFVVSKQYLNHSINGILYCTFVEKFRYELWKVLLFCRKKRKSKNCTTSMNSPNTDTTTVNSL